MDAITLGTFKDTNIDVDYRLAMVSSAKALSDTLKKVLKDRHIDYKVFNSYDENSYNKDKSISNPPHEIYEYQNFFILEKANGEFILLDGFRRLLWYNAPDAPILVKFYKESDLTDQQILTLLVNLNHFKFFANQNYHDRGFSLLLKTVFDVDITKIRCAFDAYLSEKETRNSYSSFGSLSGQSKNLEIKDRIINKFFVSDIRFLEALSKTKYLCDQYMGALLFEYRTKTDHEFDVNRFISLANENSVLQDLMEKYKKIGTDNSAKSIDLVNKIIEMYRNIFTLMEGGVVEKSFAERQKECKDLVASLKKNANLTKMTGSKNIHSIESEIEKRIKAGQDVKFVCVIHPELNPTIKIPSGLLDVKFLKFTDKHLGMGKKELNIGAIINGVDTVIWHNYNGHYGYGTKYTRLRAERGEYDVDLFVCISKKEFAE